MYLYKFLIYPNECQRMLKRKKKMFSYVVGGMSITSGTGVFFNFVLTSTYVMLLSMMIFSACE